MKKKLLIGLTAFMLMSGTTYAATAINGLYKNRPIVAVTVNGQKVVSSVPGQLIDGATMLPLRAIAEALGAQVDWNSAKQSASITTPQQPAQAAHTGLSLEQLNKIGESVGLVYILDANGQQIGTGSGFIINGSTFVTNYHVAEKADTLRIEFGNKSVTVKKSDALFSNPDADLFGVKVEGFSSVKLNTAEPKKGDKVYALGYPHKKFTITEGAVKYILGDPKASQIVHDAKTAPGSSGSILINSSGEVVGITASTTETTPLNFAIEAKYLQTELDKLK